MVIMSYYVVKRSSRILQENLQKQATKRNGVLSGSGSERILSFPYHNTKVNLSTYSGSRNRYSHQMPYTSIETDLYLKTGKYLKIYSETLASEIGKKIGMQDIQIGSEEFDKKFMIKGDDELFTIQMITIPIQEKLLRLRSLHPVVNLEHSLLKIKVPLVLNTEENFDLLIDTALLFIDRLSKTGNL
jgi:hypothetical protein